MRKEKIQIPWAEEEYNEEVQKRNKLTLEYWELSKSWNGQAGSITVHEALDKCNKVLINIDPNSKVSMLTADLQNNIINHGSKSTLNRFLKKHHPKQPEKPADMILL